VIHLLEKPDLSSKMGEMGREMVRQKFLITRLMCNYIELLNDIL
jgi:hypothetical protein